MNRLANSWTMFTTSARVLFKRKELAVFPILSGIVNVVVAATFIVPMIAVMAGGSHSDRSMSVTMYIFMGVLYFVSAYVTIFFNAALISQADVALKGGDPSVKDGLKAAGGKWLKILPWALLSATVSQILKAIQDKAGPLGNIISGIAGMAWQVVTFLVLPKLVLEDRGVIDAIKESTAALKRTWGENLAGNAGLGVVGFVAALPGIALIFLGFKIGGIGLLAMIAVAVVWFLVVAVLMTALSGIYQTALYRFAADGATPSEFGGFDLASAFRQK